MLENPDFKGAVQVYQEILVQQAINSKGLFLKRILPERLFGEMIGFLFARLDNFFNIFDEKCQQLFYAGIIAHYSKESDKFLDFKRFQHLHESQPKVLTMSHLEAGFVICAVSMSFAVAAFFLELVVFWSQSFFKNSKFKKFY